MPGCRRSLSRCDPQLVQHCDRSGARHLRRSWPEAVVDVERSPARLEGQAAAVGRRTKSTAPSCVQRKVCRPRRDAAQHAPSRCPVALLTQLDVGTVGTPRPLDGLRADPGRRAPMLQAEGTHREHRDGIDDAVDATDGQVPALRYLKRDSLAVESRSGARAIRKATDYTGENERDRNDSLHTVSTRRKPHEVHRQAPNGYPQLATTLPSARVVSLSVADPFKPSPIVTTTSPRSGTGATTRTPWLVQTTPRPTLKTPARKRRAGRLLSSAGLRSTHSPRRPPRWPPRPQKPRPARCLSS
jgi:hypothetical protein